MAWILDHTPGPRIAISIEGTRSYGIGLARAATAAGLPVLECEQPHRRTRQRLWRKLFVGLHHLRVPLWGSRMRCMGLTSVGLRPSQDK
jgi:hypothetical protein